MSRYTTQVRFICETAAGESESKGYNSLDETLEAGRNYIFDTEALLYKGDIGRNSGSVEAAPECKNE